MPSSVLDLELSRLPSEIAVSPLHDGAFALIRYRGCPVGQAWLPVAGGRVSSRDLKGELENAAGLPLCVRVLEHYLDYPPRLAQERRLSVTVAVCTRDRPADLRRCLESLAALADEPREVLVVDNCPSTERTFEVVREFSGVRYARVDVPGLNHARNHALHEAEGDVVAFCDDDAVTDPHWLGNLLENFDDPMVLAVTGLTLPRELETSAQEWQERHTPFGRGFLPRVFDMETLSPFAAGLTGAGVNVALRRDVLPWLGPFETRLDAGTPTQSGGDTEMFARILASGYRIAYEPRALSWHRHRATWAELRSAVHGYGIGVYAAWTHWLLRYGDFGSIPVAVSWLRTQLRQLGRSLLRRPNHVPLSLIVCELWGCARGPWAYLKARRAARRHESSR